MLVIDVEWLHGTLRSGSASDATITGEDDPGEWPPSPARMLAAFVAADGTGPRCRVTDGSELTVLALAPPPAIIADGPDDLTRSAACERFVVGDAMATGVVQDYPGRKATLVRAGSVLAPRRPHARYVYEDLEVTNDVVAGLQLRAARIPYIGAADHPARVTVTTNPPADDAGRWCPDGSGRHVLGVPDDGFLSRLDHAFDRFSAGEPVRRSWIATASARYRAPGDHGARPVAEVVWMRLLQSLAPERLLDLTETLRAAILSHLGDDAPALLHGHGARDPEGGAWLQARYLAFPDLGRRYADGRLHGVGVWLPPDTDASTRADVRRAIAAISTLTRPRAFEAKVVPHDGRTGIRAVRTARWRGPAHRWVSATPVVFERHGPADLDEVRRWFAHAGLPAPAMAKIVRTPLSEGAVRLQPSHLRHRYTTPYAHLEVTFDSAVAGPMVVGRGRQFGLGLLEPADSAEGGSRR